MARKRRRRRRRGEGSDSALAVRPERADLVQDLLLRAVDEARETKLPQLAALHGETGRGKSYAVQALYDRLATQHPGYWQPGLTPVWPAESLSSLRRQRKNVTPPEELRRPGETASFLWLGVGCSGYADAPRVDPTADLLRQLRRLLSELSDQEIAAARRRKWAAERVIEGIGQLEPLLGNLKYLLETALEASSVLAGQVPSPGLKERTQVFEALRAYSQVLEALGIAPTPLIVVVDDASGATSDLFQAISSFVAEPGENPGNGQNLYLPEVLDEFPPLPIVFVVTVWDHTLTEAQSPTPLARWLSEYEALELQAETIDCREIHRDEANRLLDKWPYGPDEEIRMAIVEHVASNNARGLVNPLVLAEHVASVEEKRNPFSQAIEVDESFIETLTTSPEHHVIERLDRLRETEDGGPEVFALLRLLCSLSITLPWGIVESLAETPGVGVSSERIREIFVDAGIGSEGALVPGVNPLRLFTIDADLYDFLRRNSDFSDEERAILEQASAHFLRRWVETIEPDGLLTGQRAHWSEVRLQMMALFAKQGLGYLDRAEDTVTGLAHALLSEPVDLALERPGPRSALAMTWMAAGFPPAPATDQILVGCVELGISRGGLACARALISHRDDVAERKDLLDPFLERLEQHLEVREAEVVLVEALHRIGELDRAIRVATSNDLSPQSVLLLGNILAKEGRIREAVDLLARRDGNLTVLLRRASLVADLEGVDAARHLLAPYLVGRWSAVQLICGLLARSGQDEERRSLLTEWAGKNPQAACLLAADHNGDGNPEEARSLLAPWKRTFLPAAKQLASLEWSEGNYREALAALAPFFDGAAPAAVTTALVPMLNEVGQRGLRFRNGKGGAIEIIAPPPEAAPAPETSGAKEPAGKTSGAKAAAGNDEEAVAPRSAAEIVEEVRGRLKSASPREIAEELGKRDAASASGARHVTEALRKEVLGSQGRELAAVAFYVCSLSSPQSVALACTTADLAFAGALPDSQELALAALSRHKKSSSSAVQGRLAALEALSGYVESRLEGISRLRTADRPFAFVSVYRMLGPEPSLETEAWRGLAEAVEECGDQRLPRLLWIYSTSRLLPLIRALQPDAPSTLDLLRRMLPSTPWADLIPTIEGVLNAYAEDPEQVRPEVLAYQAVSMFESLKALGRFNPDLGNRLSATIARQLSASPERIEAFSEWSTFSALADRACRQLHQASAEYHFTPYADSTTPIRITRR
jgi:hypothetical protein